MRKTLRVRIFIYFLTAYVTFFSFVGALNAATALEFYWQKFDFSIVNTTRVCEQMAKNRCVDGFFIRTSEGKQDTFTDIYVMMDPDDLMIGNHLTKEPQSFYYMANSAKKQADYWHHIVTLCFSLPIFLLALWMFTKQFRSLDNEVKKR